MTGHFVERKAGWDTHGLPVEIAVEQRLGFTSKDDIERYGIAEFNAECRKAVLEHLEDWKALTERIGYWVDLDDAYYTFDASYVESVWWALKTMWDRDLLFEGHKVVPYCARCGTALSSHEVAQGYKDVEDPSVFVRFPVVEGAGALRAGDTLLIWTTTPWTLVANAAVAVDPELTYVRTAGGEVLAEALVERVLGEGAEIADRFTGAEMVGARYEPPFGFLARLGVGPEGPYRAAGRLRQRQRRHGHRAHRDRLRRGRLQARCAAGPRRRQPGAARRHLRRAHRPVRRPLGQGRRRRPDRGPARARPAAPRGAPAARLPALLALRHAAPLLRQAVLVHPHLGDARAPARGQRDRHVVPAAHQARALRQVAGGQRRLGDLARALLGHAAARLALRERPCGVPRLVRRGRGALRARAARPAPALRRRAHLAVRGVRRGDAPRARRHRRLVRLRLDAVRAAPRAVRGRGAVRAQLPGGLHLRGDRPDARLVLLPDRDLDAAVRQGARTGRCSASATSPTRRARRCPSRWATSSCPGTSSTSTAPTPSAGTT